MTQPESSNSKALDKLPTKGMGPVPLPSDDLKRMRRLMSQEEINTVLARTLEFYDQGGNPRLATRFANLVLEARGVPVRFQEVDIVSFLDAVYGMDYSPYLSYGGNIMSPAGEPVSLLPLAEKLLRELERRDSQVEEKMDEFRQLKRAVTRARKRD